MQCKEKTIEEHDKYLKINTDSVKYTGKTSFMRKHFASNSDIEIILRNMRCGLILRNLFFLYLLIYFYFRIKVINDILKSVKKHK